jgi:hypothetical protein
MIVRRLLPLLVLLGLAAAAPSAQAAKGLEIGVQDDGQFLSDDPLVRAHAFEHARALGATALRTNLHWAAVVSEPHAATAPAEPAYAFEPYDRLVDEAAASGIRVQITLTGPAPAWASGDHQVSNVRPDPARFGAFAGAAAAHFRGRVRAFSIWNEPNWHRLLIPENVCAQVKPKRVAKAKGKGKRGRRAKGRASRKLCVKTSARIYRSLYQAAYTAIKQADPGVKVWVGETNPYVNRRKQSTAPLAFIRQMVCADQVVKGCTGTLRADGYAHHPYAFDRAPSKPFPGRDNATLGSLGQLRKQLKAVRSKLRIPGASIYLTEFAYYSGGAGALPKKTRAAYTRAAYELALEAPQVRQLVHYQIVDPPKSILWRSGLVSDTGEAHPAYKALTGFFAARKGKLAVPHGPIALPAAPTPPAPPAPPEVPAAPVAP